MNGRLADGQPSKVGAQDVWFFFSTAVNPNVLRPGSVSPAAGVAQLYVIQDRIMNALGSNNFWQNFVIASDDLNCMKSQVSLPKKRFCFRHG